jgi:sialate O-acetylesterase
MKKFNIYGRMVLVLALLCLTGYADAKIVLPAVFGNNMVLQQKTNVAFWGKADPAKKVEIHVSWNKKIYTVNAGNTGDWKLMIPTPSYGGPYKVTIAEAEGEAVTLANIMIGEVWVCSGQSNMEMPIEGWGKIDNYTKEVADANYPNIRLFQVDHTTSDVPLEVVPKVANGGWTACTPQSAAEFSAVAYFFARELHKQTGIPIGLIHTSWGGTIAEAWTSAQTLNTMPDFAAAVKKIESTQGTSNYTQELSLWQKIVLENDAGNGKGKLGWADPSLDDSSWKGMELPSFVETSALPAFDGVVYFRKTVMIPKGWSGKAITLNLGTIDDNDITYVNGEKIGATDGYNLPRVYTIPAEKVKAGANTITVRVFDSGGGGGIYGDKNILSLASATGEKISLDGEWKYKVGLNLKDVPPMPVLSSGPNRPTVLYNAMINPFIQFAIRGAIWYQGESNADRASQYRTLFPAMINDWRTKWKLGDFPFYFVQLANFMKTDEVPVASAWAELRDAQRQTLSLPNTGMAVAIDLGLADNIHPKNKQEVGRRLALIALAKNYGKKITYSGPAFASQQVEGNTIRLNFDFSDEGLVAKAGALKGFAIAGADQKFYWAKATIKGKQIIVSSPEVANPVSVRYDWANNPEGNLYNGAGLPASPFKTDNWPDSTLGKK